MVIDKALIEDIKSSTNIVDVIGEVVSLNRAGRNYLGLCPFHKEKTPSFNVIEDRQFYHCFGCGKYGDVFKFLEEYRQISFQESVKVLADRLGIAVTIDAPRQAQQQNSPNQAFYDLHEDALKFYHAVLMTTKIGEAARAYLYEREAVSDTGNDVFRRHKHCRCIVEYDAGDGKVTNVHTKKTTDKKDTKRRIENAKEWSNKQKSGKIKETPKEKEKRIKEENGLDLASRISGHPKMLGTYTPRGLYHALQNAGYETKPLKGKNYRDIPFEEGGGYRVNFGGDGLLMYHPGERSHHGGEYYKISTGKGGVKRYDINGKEKED